MNILIVDDSKIVRRVLTNTMQRYSKAKKWTELNLFEAEDGVVAMKQMEKEKDAKVETKEKETKATS